MKFLRKLFKKEKKGVGDSEDTEFIKEYGLKSIEEIEDEIKAENNIEFTDNEDNENIIEESIKVVESTYDAANLLYKKNEFDESFNQLNSATKHFPHLKQFYYLQWQKKYSQLSARICLNQPKPNLHSYIYFELSASLILLLSDISNFPNCSTFYYQKEKFVDGKAFYANYTEFDEALNSVKLLEFKNEILKEIFDFGFNELPLIYGIPKKYDCQLKYDAEFARHEPSHELVIQLSRMGRQLQTKFVDKEMNAIDKKINEVLKKYSNKT